MVASMKKKDAEDDSWKDLFAAREFEESAEEIMEAFRSSRYTSRQIEDL